MVTKITSAHNLPEGINRMQSALKQAESNSPFWRNDVDLMINRRCFDLSSSMKERRLSSNSLELISATVLS